MIRLFKRQQGLIMKLSDRIEQTERGTLLNLAHGPLADFERNFDMLGHSAKDCIKSQKNVSNFIRVNHVVEVILPYVSASQFFVDVLKMKKIDNERDPYDVLYDDEPEYCPHYDESSNFHGKVVLIIPAGADKETIDRSLFDQFSAISSITCEIRQAVVIYQPVSVDELGATHSGFAPR